jgi:osmotically inducible protein OsmC
MGDGPGTNPEELIGAAHAGCFSMALAAQLSGAGHPPERIRTNAKVHFDKGEGGWTIRTIELETEAAVPGLTPDAFATYAEGAKANCPVSRALSGVEIRLKARLL